MVSSSPTTLKNLQWIIRDHLTCHQSDRFKNLLGDRITTLHNRHHLNIGESLLYFNPVQRQLSKDGYLDYQNPSTLLKDNSISWRRRVWAQGEIESFKPLMMDQEYICQECINFVKKVKEDYFVRMERSIFSSRGGLSLREYRTLVYTNTPVNDMINQKHLQGKIIGKFKFSELDIITYTLLSLNSHRVHWDKDYSQKIEGYRNIIVQGPFAVQVLMAFAHYQLQKPISKVRYKNINYIYPEINTEICIGNHSIWMRDQEKHDKIYVWAEF